jgi:hypothetical protein
VTAPNPARLSRGRVIAFAAVAILALAGGGTYVLRQARQVDAQERAAAAVEAGTPRSDPARVRSGPHIVVRNTAAGPSYGKVALVALADPAGPRAVTDLTCERVYAVSVGGFCLAADRGVVTTYHGLLLGPDLRPVREVAITGGPSRAQLSRTGTRAASTVFVAGHSYLEVGFSTVTEVVDTATGTGFGSLETFRVVKDGRTYRSVDLNFWGVTFATDDRFYATLGTRGRTYLVRGDVRTREVTVLRENAECPSLSPDGTRIAYKRAAGPSSARRWRFTVLDLRSGVETPLPETRSIDDQLAWLDEEHVLYGVPRAGTGRSDVWVSPLSGGAPRLLIPDAESPSVVRPPRP